jgi:hypothetical protein
VMVPPGLVQADGGDLMQAVVLVSSSPQRYSTGVHELQRSPHDTHSRALALASPTSRSRSTSNTSGMTRPTDCGGRRSKEGADEAAARRQQQQLPLPLPVELFVLQAAPKAQGARKRRGAARCPFLNRGLLPPPAFTCVCFLPRFSRSGCPTNYEGK